MIDFHAHIFPEKIADKTIPHLAEVCGTGPFTNGKEEGLLQSMEKAGVTCSVILPVVTAPKQFDSINRFAMQYLSGDKLLSFGGIHPDNDNYKERLRWIKEQGFKGIKFHPDYQETYFNDIKYKRMISYASELDLIVVTHAGYDPVSPKIIHCTPQMVEEVLDEVAPTKLVLAHLGGNEMFDEVEQRLVGRDVYFDTANLLNRIEDEQLIRIIRNHGVEKILFATDSPWGDQKEFVEYFQNLSLSEIEKNKIFMENAVKLLR